MSSDQNQKPKELNLPLTPVNIDQLIDEDTKAAYEFDKTTLVGVNKSYFNESEQVVLNKFYFALSTFIENGLEFKILHPYRVNHASVKKRSFGFGCFNKKTGAIFYFFKGKGNKNREQAIAIYNQLKEYCKLKLPNMQPFAIKI